MLGLRLLATWRRVLWRSASLAFVLVPSCALAQLNWGTVTGTITDLSGAAVPGAYVGASSNTLPRGLSTVSDHRGHYSFQVLPVGHYTITVVAPGFHTLRYHNLEVRIGAQLNFHGRLSLGAVTESIDVNDSLQSLDTASSQTATTITASTFDSIARGRNFHTILMLAPGVRHEAKAGSVGVGGVSVDGASGSENTYFIDGVEVSDTLNGALRAQNSIPLEFIRQVQVKSGGFEAEFGGATGGVINVATRGGSNALHGELAFQATSHRFNAGDRGFYQRSPFDAKVAEFIRPPEDAYAILYPGFSFGGPLLRDRVFGFVSYMPEFENAVRKIDYELDGRRVYRNNRVRQYALSRLDIAARRDLQINSSWVWSPARRMGLLPARDSRLRAPANDVGQLGEFVPSQTFSVSASYSLSSRSLVSLRYGYKYFNSKTLNYGVSDAPYIQYRSSAPDLSGIGGPDSPIGPPTNSGSFAVARDIATRHNLYLDASRVAVLAGQQHIIKGGYALNRIYNDVADGYSGGRFDIFWNEAFSRGGFTGETGKHGYYIWEDGPRQNSRALGRNHSLFVQDAWRVHTRVNLNLGLRVEREYLPPYQAESSGRRIANPLDFGWGEKIAPRLGAAWDIRGDGKWKLSGSYGMFYDLMKYGLARTAFGGEYWVSHVYRLDQPWVSGLHLRNPGALGTKITQYDNRVLPVNERGEIASVDPGIRPYASRELSLSLDHAVTSRLQAGIRYTRKQLMQAIEDIGVLDSNDNEVYLIGNPGFGLTRDSRSVYGGKTPNGREWLVPRARRQYDALEFRVEGQWSRFHLLSSYTFSRLWGNYAGLANSDEAGRMEPSVSRSFDLPTYYFDASGQQRNVEGRLATDRPHVFKIFSWRDFSSRLGVTNLGFTQTAMTGGLDSTTVGYLTAPTFPFGRGDLGRLPVFTQTDINVSHTFRLNERTQLKLEATAMNALNQAAVISRVTQMNRNGNITAKQLPWNQFFAGYNPRDFVNAGSTTPFYNPIYGLPGGDPMDGGLLYHAGKSDVSSAFLATNPGFGAYQGPRSIRLGIRLSF